jgi:hypothetical protein
MGFLQVVIDPKNLCTVIVSPRQRAHKLSSSLRPPSEFPNHMLTEEVREWDYGEDWNTGQNFTLHLNLSGQYEGLLSSEIKEKDPGWSIWEDG